MAHVRCRSRRERPLGRDRHFQRGDVPAGQMFDSVAVDHRHSGRETQCSGEEGHAYSDDPEEHRTECQAYHDGKEEQGTEEQ